MTVSKEMSKRGFNASKSAETRINDDNGDGLNSDPAIILSPPQVLYGHRKKLTDLKIDMNFVPKKNKMKRSTSIAIGSNLQSPDGKNKTFPQQPRIRVANSSTTTNGNAAGSYSKWIHLFNFYYSPCLFPHVKQHTRNFIITFINFIIYKCNKSTNTSCW